MNENNNNSSQQSHNWLQSLGESLHHLFLKVSEKLRHRHLQNSEMGEAKGTPDIWQKIGTFVEQTPLITEEEDLVLLSEKETQQIKRKTAAPTKREKHADQQQGSDEKTETALGKYYHEEDLKMYQHPHMSDQMQEKTMEHIFTSLHLARKGDQQGARLHIELAESAMHTASRFMSHEDYAAFEVKVDKKLENIISNGYSH